MFDAAFYAAVFPELVQQECRRQPGKVPVVQFRVGDGATLDVCHFLQLSEKWLAVAFFRDPETCEDMDIAFLPYELVVRIIVSLHSPESRRLGFRVGEPTPAARGEGEVGKVEGPAT